MDTIFALSSAPGKAGVAVIRLSGSDSVAALARLTDVPEPRLASVRLLSGQDGVRLDEALILVFQEGQSFTGEQSVEIQCHGSPAVVNAILGELGRMSELRAADAGEFTRRALLNNRLDLAQVEGLADLIEAETEAQRRQALRVFAGDLGETCEAWRNDLIRAAALMEATIDFADEEVPTDVSPEVNMLIDRVSDGLDREIKGVTTAERVRTGFEVAIVGAPNVGKSTLLNTISGRESAITSEYAGTTRDVIEVRMDLHGLPVTFLDTAGIRDTDDAVESIGIDRALKRAAQADLRVVLVSEGNVPDVGLKQDDIVLAAKADLVSTAVPKISGKTGEGVSEMLDRISQTLRDRTASIGVTTHVRHQIAMKQASDYLANAKELMSLGGIHTDLAAEELRSAIRALDSLVGRIDIENVLDEIFSSFCLGK